MPKENQRPFTFRLFSDDCVLYDYGNAASLSENKAAKEKAVFQWKVKWLFHTASSYNVNNNVLIILIRQ